MDQMMLYHPKKIHGFSTKTNQTITHTAVGKNLRSTEGICFYKGMKEKLKHASYRFPQYSYQIPQIKRILSHQYSG
jgi:hypothetical protein